MSAAKRHLSRKKAQEAQKLKVFDGLLEDVFANFKLSAAKVDEKPMLYSASSKITKQLGDVFVVERLDGLDFHEQRSGDKQVSAKIAKDCPVLVVHGQRELGFDLQRKFTQPMQHRVLVDLFDVPVPVIAMNCKSRFTHDVTQLEDFSSSHSWFSFFEPFVPFYGKSL